MLIKVISILSSLTLLSRILGYLRDLLIAKVVGAGLVSDCFFIAFKLPNLFRRLFAEGSMNSAFIPVVSGVKQKLGRIESDRFFSKIFSLLIVFLFFFVILLEIFAPFVLSLIAPGFSENSFKKDLAVDFSRLTFPFLFFICATSLIGAYLNTLGKFASMALTPIILNVTIILCLLIFFKNGDKVFVSYYLSLSISLAGVLQFIWMLFNLKKNKINLKFESFLKKKKKKEPTNKFFKLLIPAILGNGVYQLNLLIDMILASTLAHGSISFLYYADRVNQLPLGVLGIAISTALLPILSKYVKQFDAENVKKSLTSAVRFGLLFSIPSFVGILILSDEIVSFIFRGEFDFSDVKQTSAALVALSFGLPAFVMIKILVVPFFAKRTQ